jgi:hypothetical protein
MGGGGEPPFSPRNGVWRLDLGAHPKLGALLRALLELHFLPDVGSLYGLEGVNRSVKTKTQT